jgi:YegS/Rv2252/BmrU family lipid kinase
MVNSYCSFAFLEKRLLYIINPIAGTGARSTLQELIHQHTKQAGVSYEITTSSKEGNYESTKQLILDKKITNVIIAGGDGTVSQVIAALKETGVNFGILPCGSGNGLARAAKIPLSMKEAIELAINGESKATDGFLLNNQFACMLSGLGFDATVAHSFAKQPGRGLYTYTKEVIRHFGKAKPFAFRLRAHQTTIEIEAYLISIANGNQYGNNFTIAPKAKLDDQLLDVVMLTPQSKLSLIWKTIRQLTGQNPVVEPHPSNTQLKVIYWQVKELSIENLDKAPLHIDGDSAATIQRADIAVVPQAFSLTR